MVKEIQAEKVKIDLGPRALTVDENKTFFVSSDAINAVSEYLKTVDETFGARRRTGLAPELQALLASADSWKTEVIPAMTTMAESLVDYGDKQAPSAYEALRQGIEKLDQHPGDAQARRRFEAAIQALIDRCDGFVEESRKVLKLVSTFTESIDKGETYIGEHLHDGVIANPDDLYWRALKEKRKKVNTAVALEATQKVFSTWQQLYRDLVSIKENTTRMLDEKMPVFFDFEVDLALRQWKDVAQGAWEFKLAIL